MKDKNTLQGLLIVKSIKAGGTDLYEALLKINNDMSILNQEGVEDALQHAYLNNQSLQKQERDMIRYLLETFQVS